MRLAERIKNLPPYLFAELDRKVAKKKETMLHATKIIRAICA